VVWQQSIPIYMFTIHHASQVLHAWCWRIHGTLTCLMTLLWCDSPGAILQKGMVAQCISSCKRKNKYLRWLWMIGSPYIVTQQMKEVRSSAYSRKQARVCVNEVWDRSHHWPKCHHTSRIKSATETGSMPREQIAFAAASRWHKPSRYHLPSDALFVHDKARCTTQ
jgi:hypothetical protein